MVHSQTEENYLKTIYKLSKPESAGVSTTSIGNLLGIKPPTVSDMIRKLGEKKLIKYTKYKGVKLTAEGEKVAIETIRKHRLWETFLVWHFGFKWDEVHDIAEQLEHINSTELVNRLDKFLGFPQFDPHGDPIPDEKGKIYIRHEKTLDMLKKGEEAIIAGVNDHSSAFLQYLENEDLGLGDTVNVLDIIDYDKSFTVVLKNKIKKQLSHTVCKNIFIKNPD